MSKKKRHDEILRLISENVVETQGQLTQMLLDEGFDVTQATVSRDIKELQLIKVLTASGKYKYSKNKEYDTPISERFTKIFKETVTSVEYSGNIVVVKTLSGCANAAAEAIDSTKFPHIVGTVAGDNTFLVIGDAPENAPKLVDLLNETLRFK